MLAGYLGLHWISVLSYSKAKLLRKDQDQAASDQRAASGLCKTETSMSLTHTSFYHLSTCWSWLECSFSRMALGSLLRLKDQGVKCGDLVSGSLSYEAEGSVTQSGWRTWVGSSLEISQSLSDTYWVLLSDHRWQDNIFFSSALLITFTLFKDLLSWGRSLQGEDCDLIVPLSHFYFYHFFFIFLEVEVIQLYKSENQAAEVWFEGLVWTCGSLTCPNDSLVLVLAFLSMLITPLGKGVKTLVTCQSYLRYQDDKLI